MAKKALEVFPREPEGSVAAVFKQMSEQDLQDVLGEEVLASLKTEPMLHQYVCLIIGLLYNRWLFALDMGAGKTKLAVDIFTVRKNAGEAKQAIVLVPPVGIWHWEREVRKHSDWTARVIAGEPEEKWSALWHSKEDVIICSSEWLVRVFSHFMENGHEDDAQKVYEHFRKFDFVILDEAHRFMGHESKGFIGTDLFLADAPFMFLFTGTPVGNSYSGVWALYYLLDRGKTYLKDFASFTRKWFQTFMVKGRFPVRSLRPALKHDFFERFWTRAIRYEESEMQGLPPKNYVTLPVDMTPKQAKLYEALLEQEGATEWDFRAVTGGWHPDLQKEAIPSAKLPILEYYVNEVVIEGGSQLLIWHWNLEEGSLIANWLRKKFGKKFEIGEYRSEITDKQKKGFLDAWHSGKAPVMVANPASLGISVDLLEATVAIYYSNGHKVIDRAQSEKRNHRTGQKRPCLYVDALCRGTVDELVLEGLLATQSKVATLTRDQARKAYKARKGALEGATNTLPTPLGDKLA